jgi:hypothetical protein
MRGLQLVLFGGVHALSRALEGGERGALADFLLDCRILNKIRIAAALRLPISQAIGN